MSFSLMPENALVGFITYGATAQIYELSFDEMPKSYVFNGNKEVTVAQINALLGNKPVPGAAPAAAARAPVAGANPKGNKFLCPLSECEIHLTSIVEALQRDPHPVKHNCRPQRCTGTALSLAVSVLEASYANQAARIMTFMGGAVTTGPGMIVSTDLKEPIRSHTDVVKDRAPHSAKGKLNLKMMMMIFIETILF